jgi:DNA (cytosine-5)-methyltransferase 1
MKFISVFAGIGGFDLGLERSGHECIGQIEIDKHATSVLKKHWKDVPKHDDIRTAKKWAEEKDLKGKVDIVCGGFPCQDLSIAGNRAGIAGARSGLFYDAIQFAKAVEAKYVILENVPGLLSSNKGRDFGTVLNTLDEAGYTHIEWRILDSQFFGVAQRRKRVFIIASTIDRSRRPILIEQESSSRNNEAIKEARQEDATKSRTSSKKDKVNIFGKVRRAQSKDDYDFNYKQVL